jgi:DNA-binding response OmpR family regulator
MNTSFAPPKILIVDDEPVICEILEFNLINEGFDVTCVHSAEEALNVLTPFYSLILLDVMMAGMSGYKLVEKLRQKNIETPVIFLTAKDTENDMLTGFSVGGDDYISKPFSIKEVVARVRAILKRYDTPGEKRQSKLVFDDITIDLEMKSLAVGSKKIILTKTEFELIVLLSGNPERFYSREDIIDRIWRNSPDVTDRTVDVHITRLRKKLGERASLIFNRPGFGYRFNIYNE